MLDPLHRLREAAAARDITTALTEEWNLYRSQVRDLEQEENYRFWFDQIAEPMRDLARSMPTLAPATGPGLCFFLHGSSVMAHTAALYETLKHKNGERCIVVCFNGDGKRLRNLFDVPVFSLASAEDYAQRFEMLRVIMKDNECGTLVWVSSPLYAHYAFARRIASRQVFWAMRFHPIKSDDLDVRVTVGRRAEHMRVVHGETWNCVHLPCATTLAKVNADEAERYRIELGATQIIGTVAREQKIAHPDYLRVIADALHAIPDSLFVWTGRVEHPEVRRFFLDENLARRHRFVGWVEPDKLVSLLDVFCETVPQGGTMTWIAMGRGVPAVGLKCDTATYGWIDSVPDDAPAAAHLSEYAALVQRMIEDTKARNAAIIAGQKIYERERAMAQADSHRALRVIARA